MLIPSIIVSLIAGILFLIMYYLISSDIGLSIILSFIFLVIGISIIGISYYRDVSDVEILNGEVNKKYSWKFECPMNTFNPCRNGYPCNCKTVSYVCGSDPKTGSLEYCTRIECDTCYLYEWEQNWYVESNISKEWEIDRVDAQGKNIPKRWDEVNLGDPVSVNNTYFNWVKAAYKSLFHEDGEINDDLKLKVPEYPSKIYDYYKIDRIVTIDYNLKEKEKWNLNLSEILKKLGPEKEVNVIIVHTKDYGEKFPIVIRNIWRGFKKNDVVIVLQYSSDELNRVSVMSWSKNEMLNVSLRDDIYNTFVSLKEISVNEFMSIVEKNIKDNFVRRPMTDFEYLKDDIELSSFVYYSIPLLFFILLGIGVYVKSSLNLNRRIR